MAVCSMCGKSTTRMYPNNTCQGCYKYFRNGGTVNPLPKMGEVSYDSRGYVICHICGRAYIRLGSHIKETHHLTISEYKERFGLCNRSKTTEKCYSQHMQDLAYRYGMPDKLIEMGKKTRIKKGQKVRLGKKSRLQECLERSTRGKVTV